jgi:hypothetical protein
MLESNSALPQFSSDLGLFTKLMIIWRDRRNCQSLIRPLRTMFIVSVCFVCAWLPYAVLVTLGQFVSFDWIGPYLVVIAGLIAKSYVAFNPVIYVLTDETFRRRMLGILHLVDIIDASVQLEIGPANFHLIGPDPGLDPGSAPELSIPVPVSVHQ